MERKGAAGEAVGGGMAGKEAGWERAEELLRSVERPPSGRADTGFPAPARWPWMSARTESSLPSRSHRASNGAADRGRHGEPSTPPDLSTLALDGRRVFLLSAMAESVALT